jgi:hypothetical protein
MDKKTSQSGYWLFLDDERMPRNAFAYTHNDAYLSTEWIIVRNYDEFVKTIEIHGLPSLISFDHDLADVHYGHLYGNIPYDKFTEKTGRDCAKWLVEYCLDRDLDPPLYMVHSMNPTGSKNIRGLLDNFIKFRAGQKDTDSPQK